MTEKKSRKKRVKMAPRTALIAKLMKLEKMAQSLLAPRYAESKIAANMENALTEIEEAKTMVPDDWEPSKKKPLTADRIQKLKERMEKIKELLAGAEE